jgi:hypothetical protein
MLVAIQSFGSIWTVRDAAREFDCAQSARRRAYYNTTGVLAGGRMRNRSCLYGHVRVDECSGFHHASAGRIIHRVYESEGLTVWNGRNKLFLRRLTPMGTRPDVHLFGISAAELGWIERNGAWKCDASQVISFSEGNGQQEALLVLPAFGWVRGKCGTFCVDPRRDRPWIATLVATAS